MLSYNRDDHAKNFSYLMDEKGNWFVSPAYDLTFSSGPGGEHCTTVMGEGKNPKLAHLLKLAEIGSIKKAHVMEIIEKVNLAVSRWSEFAQQAGVTTSSQKLVQTALSQVRDKFFVKGMG